MPPRIELRTGPGRRLRLARGLVVTAALAGLLLSATGTAWKLLSLAALLTVAVYGRLSPRPPDRPARLVLGLDGCAQLERGDKTVHCRLEQGGWTSAYLSVLRLRDDTGAPRHCLVCAPQNDPDAYRRLRVLLRVGPAGGHGMRA